MKACLSFNDFIGKFKWDKKIIIVANYTIAAQYMRLANDQGIPCINLECKTIKDLVYGLCKTEAALNDRELKFIGEDVATNLIMDIMNQELAQLRYFTNQAWIDIPTAGEIFHQLSDIRITDAREILKDLGKSHKIRDLSILLDAYEKRLKDESLLDYVDLLSMAITLVKKEDIVNTINIGIFANTNVIGLERQFIEALAGPAIHLIKAPRIEGFELPDTNYSKDPQSYELGNDLSKLYSDESSMIQEPNVGFFRAYGQVNEFKYVVQDILNNEYAFGDVQVIFSNNSYALFLYNDAQSMGLNLSLPGGIPGYHSEIYAFLRDLFTFIRNGYFAENLKPVFHNRLLNLDINKKSNHSLFEDFYNQGIGFGRNRYEKIINHYQTFKESTDETEQCFFVLGEFLGEILTLFPVDIESTVKLNVFIRMIASFMLTYCTKDTINGDNQRECHQIVSALLEFAEFSTIELSLKDAMNQILIILEGQNVKASPESEDAILGTNFFSAGYVIRPYVYVIGLDASRFPIKANESPVLLDTERQSMGMDFGLSARAESHSIYGLLESLSGNTKQLMLGYNYFDTVGIKEKNASSLYNRFLENQGIDRKTIHKSGFIGDPKDILEEKEYYIFATKQKEIQKTITRKRYDLWNQVKPSGAGISSLSASSISMFLDCPRKYFYQYRAKLTPPEVTEYDRTIWLDTLNKGTFIHKVLEDYVSQSIIGEKEKEFKENVFHDVFKKGCEDMLEMVPYLSRTAYEMQRKRFSDDARGSLIQLCDEMHRDGFIPVATELAFGMRGENPVDLILSDGDAVKLRGSIDRVDVLRDGTYRIVDYKTGKFSNMKKKRDQGSDSLIQDYIYAVILEVLYADKSAVVTASRFDFPCDRYAHLVTDITKTTKNELVNKLTGIAVDIKIGKYERCACDPDKYINWETTCGYCDYGTLCQAETCAWEG